MRRIWSAVTCDRFRRPRLVAATFGKHKPRGDKSPHTKALTSQRTPHATRPLPRPLSQWERGENLSRSKQQPKPRRHGVKEIDVIGGALPAAHCSLTAFCLCLCRLRLFPARLVGPAASACAPVLPALVADALDCRLVLPALAVDLCAGLSPEEAPERALSFPEHAYFFFAAAQPDASDAELPY